MPIARAFMLLAVSAAIQPPIHLDRFIPTSVVVTVASIAARDEGYDPNAEGTYLDELRNKDGKEPYSGYSTIALYSDGHVVRSYSIRIETGDIVDIENCKVFRYANLIKFKKKILKDSGAKEASIDTIASEVGCDKLEEIPTTSRK